MSSEERERSIAYAREKARRTVPVLICVLLAVVAMYLPLPKRFIAVVPLLLAVGLSVRLLRFLSNRRGREKIWPAMTLGIVGLLLASLAVQGAFYRTVQAYEQCIDGAQTAQARADCEGLRDSIVLGDVIRLA
ncbi:hypothetical protein BA895_08890 [Humibacillus sp. DSM 29435]|uniref:hypothetical protein n=1 Tax=Humibacillus sp. DSM 29435 TaxID=1869167 RepID=UPI000871E050|nr:hypothetical protein [Humibacillus sp. DSM 29435]OFE14786.1 hypothetical protein BA895_08890 [Humibacillus sp. DSM 29435]